ncbi:MAG: hypothetical protein RJA70_2211, partial [Pseudomonadota bacterium]
MPPRGTLVSGYSNTRVGLGPAAIGAPEFGNNLG